MVWQEYTVCIFATEELRMASRLFALFAQGDAKNDVEVRHNSRRSFEKGASEIIWMTLV
jgi:hypothetical protein